MNFLFSPANVFQRKDDFPTSPNHARTQADAIESISVLLISILCLGTVAVSLGADGNYDLRNYHFYNGWALFNKPFGYDIAPAQIQGYQHPLLDGIFYQFWRALNDMPRWFTFVWSIPQSAAVWLTYLISREVLAEAGSRMNGLAIAAAFIGAGGATSVGVIGTSMSDGPLNVLIFGAMLLLARDWRRGFSAWRIGLAGSMAGAAVTLKLTAGPYLVAFPIALLFAPGLGGPICRVRRLSVFAGGSILALAALGAPWWWMLYTHFGNPLFPYFNALFHSPDYGNWNFADDRFFPHGAWQWLFYPLEWTLRKTTLVSEYRVRDARIAMALISSMALLALRVTSGSRTLSRDMMTWCAIWTLFSYVLWLKVFSILRYASGLEMMSGIVIVLCLYHVMDHWTTYAMKLATTCAVAILLLATTVYPIWDRRKDAGTHLLDVSMRKLPPNSLAILLVGTPASYVAAFQLPSVRFIGVHNNLIYLDSQFGLQWKIESAIRSASGQIWGIDKTDDFVGQAEESLRRYGLRRTGECDAIESNVDTHLRICRLERIS